MSWSRDVTDAMVGKLGASQAGVVFGHARWWWTTMHLTGLVKLEMYLPYKTSLVLGIVVMKKYRDHMQCGEDFAGGWVW
jgi:hypothetical protein